MVNPIKKTMSIDQWELNMLRLNRELSEGISFIADEFRRNLAPKAPAKEEPINGV